MNIGIARIRLVMPLTIASALVVLGIASHAALGQEVRVVVPNALKYIEGDVDVTTATSPFRWQQLSLAHEFAALPETHRTITGASFRPDKTITEPRTVILDDFLFRLSTTSKYELDIAFDNNVGADVTTVLEGPITVSTQATGPAEGPRGFDYFFDFDRPFVYDPGAGNLLFEGVSFSGQVPTFNEDFDSSIPAVWNSNPNATTGSQTTGIVVQWVFTPEPLVGQILIDDFNDGNDDGWTHFDALPGAPVGPGIFNGESGAYNLKSTGIVPVATPHFLGSAWNKSTDPLFSNGFLRARVRVNAEGTIAWLFMRDTETPYLFAADTATNELSIQGGRNDVFVALEDITFAVGEDWNIEGGVLGNRLTMKAWRVGEAEPLVPQVQTTDSSLTMGQFGIGANVSVPFPEPAYVDATFDDIYFRPADPAGDCSQDGLLNATDLSCVTTIEARDAVLDWFDTLPGDVDGDGDVAFADFLVLSANFGQDTTSYADGNIDLKDGVAFADFLLLSDNFGKTPSDVAAVPEPNAFAMLWLGLASVVALRRKRRR